MQGNIEIVGKIIIKQFRNLPAKKVICNHYTNGGEDEEKAEPDFDSRKCRAKIIIYIMLHILY